MVRTVEAGGPVSARSVGDRSEPYPAGDECLRHGRRPVRACPAGYPPEIAESVLAYQGGTPASVVEVGAGTDVLVRIGAPITCVEPDARMAARLTERFPDTRVEVTTFERWAPPAGGVDVLACAMAWHWLDAATRNALAPDAEGGTRLLLKVVMRTNPVIALGGCLGDLVMARRQLLNLKRLAEQGAVPGR